MGDDEAVGDIGGFAHDIAEATGQLEAAVERMDARGFHGQGGAAHRGPGQARRHTDAARGLLGLKQRFAEQFLDIFFADPALVGARPAAARPTAADKAHDRLAHDARELLFEMAHPRLAAVGRNHVLERRVVDPELPPTESVALKLLGPQVIARDRQFLLGDITGQAQRFHAIEKRRGNRIELVRGAHKQHLRQVHAQIEIMIEKPAVLLGVQRFEERGGGIAAKRGADLVDLIEHNHRIGDLDLFQGLDKFARQGADIGAAVAFDFRLVAHTAETEAIKLAPQGRGDGFADARFTDARRTDQQQDRAGDLALKGAHGQELEDAVFHVLQAIVLLVEHGAGVLQIEIVFRGHPPGQLRRPVEVVAGNAVLGGAGLQHGQLLQFVFDTPGYRVGYRQPLQARAKPLGVGGAIVFRDTQLFLDDFQLLTQKEFTLLIRDFLVHLLGDLAAQFGHFALFSQQGQNLLHARLQGQRVENFLQARAVGGGQGGGKVGQQTRLIRVEVGDVVAQFFAVQGVEGQEFLNRLQYRHGVGLDIVAVEIALAARVFHLHPVGRLVTQPAQDAKTAHALSQELLGVIRHCRRAVQAHGAAHLGKMPGLGRFARGLALIDVGQSDDTVGGLGNRADGAAPLVRVHGDGLHLTGEERTLRHGNKIERIGQHIVRHRRRLSVAGRLARHVGFPSRERDVKAVFLVVPHLQKRPVSLPSVAAWRGRRTGGRTPRWYCRRAWPR